nr:DUF2750 domain-containing protein [uncultured Mucilaginibacter sp.]
MLNGTATTERDYQLFIEKVAASKLVWGLKDKKGWANSSSAGDEEVDVIPFWSERAYAKACARDDWKDYTPTEIPLAYFLEEWCVGMDENDTLVGVNWNAKMIGHEDEALAIALDILNQLKVINSAIKFTNYSSIDEFIAEISEEEDKA